MHYPKDPSSLSSNVLYYKSQDSKTYWTRVCTFLQQPDMQDNQTYIFSKLFDGPLETSAALFFLAGGMGLIPMKDNLGWDGAPVLYALKSMIEGSTLPPADPKRFVELVARLLDHKKIRKYLTTSLIEFHDYLKLIDAPQADRFMTDLVKALFQRTGDLSPLLATPGLDEDLVLSEGYPGTLRKALDSEKLLDVAIAQLKPREATAALLRFGWQELRARAPQKGRDASFGQDLGL